MRTYSGMGESVIVIVDYGHWKSDVLRICPLGLLLHLNWLSLNTQKYIIQTKMGHTQIKMSAFKYFNTL